MGNGLGFVLSATFMHRLRVGMDISGVRGISPGFFLGGIF